MFEQPRHLEDAVKELRVMVAVERDPGLGGAAVQHKQGGTGPLSPGTSLVEVEVEAIGRYAT